MWELSTVCLGAGASRNTLLILEESVTAQVERDTPAGTKSSSWKNAECIRVSHEVLGDVAGAGGMRRPIQ